MALNPYLSTALSDTQHCLLTQSLERGIMPQQLELVRASRMGHGGMTSREISQVVCQGSGPQSLESPLSALTHRGVLPGSDF